MPLLCPPLPPRTETILRLAVLELRSEERRRVFAPVLHVGWPGGPRASYDPEGRDVADHGVRTDVVAAMLHRMCRSDAAPLVWLTRTGELALADVDAAWVSAAGQAFAEAGRSMTMVVVTRQGWWDPRSDARRVWRRLRTR